MRILALSDIHSEEGRLKKIIEKHESDADLILIAGDVTDFGDVDEVKKLLGCIKKPFFYVLGNCDPLNGLGGIKGLEGHYIHKRIVRFQELHIAGLSGSGITPFNTNIEFSEKEFSELVRSIRNEISSHFEKLILVTHEPPAGSTVGLTGRGVSVGSYALREFIENQKPILAICGHIHEGRGIDIIEKTVVVNPGPVRSGYYALIDIIKGGEVNVELRKLSSNH